MPAIRHNRMTDREVRNLRSPGLYADGDGLYLHIQNQDAKAWVYRYQTNGKTREMGLGPLRDVSLAEAREARNDAKKLLRQGIDPIDQRKNKRAEARRTTAVAAENARTVADVWTDWRPQLQRSTRSGYKHKVSSIAIVENHILPKLGAVPIRLVNTKSIHELLMGIKGVDTPRRVRMMLNTIFEHAVMVEFIAANPVRQVKIETPKKNKHPRLRPEDHPAFMRRLRTADGTGARALEFLILSGMRADVIRTARWDQLDDRGWLTIAKEKMKGPWPLDYRVHLTARMQIILDEMRMQRRNRFIFPGFWEGDRPIGERVMRDALYRLVPPHTVHVHGFRATFRTWAQKQPLGLADYMTCEAAIGHAVKDPASGVYIDDDFLDRRIPLMNAWNDYCG